MQEALDVPHFFSNSNNGSSKENIKDIVCAKVADLANHVRCPEFCWLVLPVDEVTLPPRETLSTIRVHARVILLSVHWSLWHFGDVRGLLLAMCDVVNGHKHLYYECRSLHRGVNFANIIISSHGDRTIALLIDLDYAKPTWSREWEESQQDIFQKDEAREVTGKEGDQLLVNNDSGTRTQEQLDGLNRTKVAESPRTMKMCDASPEQIERVKKLLLGGSLIADTAVIEKCIKYVPNGNAVYAAGYIRQIVKSRKKHFHLQADRVIKLVDLGWDVEILDPPDLSTREGEPTGTLPFMSIECLKGDSEFYDDDDDEERTGQWFNDALHDIESLFWVLMYLCLSRRGPGVHMWRYELLKESAINDEELNKLLIDNFYSNTECKTYLSKWWLFSWSSNMKKAIQKFHPYFEDLKFMMIQWWSVLRAAYKHHKIEYYTIHDQVLGILNGTICNLRDESDEHLSLTGKASDGNARHQL